MSKVILTKEQAKFVEKYKAVRGLAEKLSKAISEGYEVESEFNAGDKVLFTASKKPVINNLKDKSPFDCGDWMTKEGSCIGESDFRHATPEEVYWLETLGRDSIADFKHGDIFIDAEGAELVLGGMWELNDAAQWYKDSDFKGIYPAESFKRYPQEDE